MTNIFDKELSHRQKSNKTVLNTHSNTLSVTFWNPRGSRLDPAVILIYNDDFGQLRVDSVYLLTLANNINCVPGLSRNEERIYEEERLITKYNITCLQ